MKRLIAGVLCAGLALQGVANAAQLYTVSINLTPKNIRAQIFLINTAKNAPSGAACHAEETYRMTCKLPAGEYELSIFEPDDFLVSFDFKPKKYKIFKNTVINQDIKVAFKKNLNVSAEGKQIFNRLAIALLGETEDCATPVMPRLCSTSDISLKTAEFIISSSKDLKQTEAWAKASDLAIGNFVSYSGKRYQIILSETSDGGTFMQFIAP